jgi:hypothetical protein
MTIINFFTRRIALPALVFAGLTANQANAAVTSAFDGNWYDPETIGQGFIFETYPDSKGQLSLVVIHLSYNADGSPTFFTAAGEITGELTTMPLLKPIAGRQISPGVFEPPRFLPAGKLALSFDNCNLANATVQIDAQATTLDPKALASTVPVAKVRVGTGTFKLQRLGASTQAKRCTGGLSDNTFAGQSAEGFEQFISTPQFGARAIFEKRPDASDFRLEMRDLPVGSYSLTLPNDVTQQFNALPFGSGTKAELHFRSPALPGFAALLDFEVIGKRFSVQGIDRTNMEIRQSFTLTTQVGAFGFTNGPASAALSVNERFNLAQVRGQGTRANSSFILDTQFDRSTSSEEFKVFVEGAEAGTYDVFIDNVRRAAITVKNQPDFRAAGEVYFRSPATVGSYPLDFDPRGVSIELRRDGVIEYGATLRE